MSVKCNAYSIALSTFEEGQAPKPREYQLPNFRGASTSPVFSPDGKKAAFLSMKTAGYEADKNQIFLVPDVAKNHVVHMLSNNEGTGSWDRSPQVSAFLSVDNSGFFAGWLAVTARRQHYCTSIVKP